MLACVPGLVIKKTGAAGADRQDKTQQARQSTEADNGEKKEKQEIGQLAQPCREHTQRAQTGTFTAALSPLLHVSLILSYCRNGLLL